MNNPRLMDGLKPQSDTSKEGPGFICVHEAVIKAIAEGLALYKGG